MYTGIVQAMLPVTAVHRHEGLMNFSVDMPEVLLHELELGGSVAVNGCCFTVTTIKGASVSFDAIAETLAITNIKEIKQGSFVNIERSAKSGAEVGGHVLSGHIADVAKVKHIEHSENNQKLILQGKPSWMKYVFNKGFLAVNGCSLTVASVDQVLSELSINLIPETLKRTNFSYLKVGDALNIEIEQQTQVIVDTVERVMNERYKA